jgi:hypothetical protein
MMKAMTGKILELDSRTLTDLRQDRRGSNRESGFHYPLESS